MGEREENAFKHLLHDFDMSSEIPAQKFYPCAGNMAVRLQDDGFLFFFKSSFLLQQ